MDIPFVCCNRSYMIENAQDSPGRICFLKGHVIEYPTMHYFGIPRHTQSLILTEYFWKFLNCIVGVSLTCPIRSYQMVFTLHDPLVMNTINCCDTVQCYCCVFNIISISIFFVKLQRMKVSWMLNTKSCFIPEGILVLQ